MRSRRSFGSLLAAALSLVLFPATARAQSTIAGIVKDTTGAVLPGVTVEAASPVLIEKLRTVTTDNEGRYAIVDIRPGTYTVSFTLAGFNTFKREEIEVPANVTVPLNAEMKVGALEETVTVSGASPVVDVQNASKVQVMTRDLMDSIPSARNIQSVGALVPGVRLNVPDVGGAQQTEQTYMAAHGNSALHNTILLDGMPAQTNLVDGAVQNYIDNALVSEATYQTSGVSADTPTGGVRLNLIPKDGGNTIHGSGFFGGAADSWHLQSTNVTPELTGRGLQTGARVQHLNDFNVSIGGPVIKDKLWYFGSGRYQSTFVQIPNTFVGKLTTVGPNAISTAGADPGIEDADIKSFAVRGTWQATPRNKFAATYQRNYKWKGHEISLGGQEGLPIFPDISSTNREPVLYYIGQAKWTSPITSRLLAEGGYSSDILHYSNLYQPGIGQERGTPGWYALTSRLDTVAGGNVYRTNAGQLAQWFYPNQDSAVASLSYVTGSHNVKTGFLWGFGSNGYRADMNGDLYEIYQGGSFVNGVYTLGQPRQVRVYNTPISRFPELKANIGVYAQDQWALNKFTFSYGIRYEYLREEIPAQDRVAGRFVPAQHYDALTCKSLPGMTCWSSWSPRLGVTYDLFGTGKTALKASFGKFMTPDVSAFANQFSPINTLTDTRNWTDTDPTGRHPETNGDGIVQDYEIGPSNNPNFGKVTNRSLDPNFKREYNLQYSAGIQHELRTGVAVNFNWFRRQLYNTQLTVNRAVNPDTDWSRTAIVNPLNGSPLPVFLLNQSKFGLAPDYYVTNGTDTNLRRNIYTGFELGTNARLPRRTLLFAGWTFERGVDVDCTMNLPTASSLFNDPNNRRFCDLSGQLFQELGANPQVPFRHEFKLNGNLPLWYGFEVSASFQSYAGQPKAAVPTPATIQQYITWTVTPGSTRYPTDCVGCPAGAVVLPQRFAGDPTLTLRLVPAGLRYEPRWNELDLGFRRNFHVGTTLVQAQIEVFNALNASPVLSEGVSMSSSAVRFMSDDPNAGGTPLAILQPRIIRLGLQFKF